MFAAINMACGKGSKPGELKINRPSRAAIEMPGFCANPIRGFNQTLIVYYCYP